jgi:PAS domain S-box-containing protein
LTRKLALRRKGLSRADECGSLQCILQHASDIIIAVDRAGMITFWNDGAERLLGFPRARALGARLGLIIPPHLRERHLAGFKHALASDASLAPAWVKTPVLRADGTITRMAITVVVEGWASASGMLAIVQDVAPAAARAPQT